MLPIQAFLLKAIIGSNIGKVGSGFLGQSLRPGIKTRPAISAGKANWEQTMFEKGKSGNPRGRPIKDRALAEIAMKHAEEVLRVWAEILRNTEAKDSDRIRAGAEIMDRGFGKAPQSLIHSGDVNLSLGDELDGFVRRIKQRREHVETGDSQLH